MRHKDLIAKLIDLEERAQLHSSEYFKMIQMRGDPAKASLHYRKVIRLRSRIKDLMKQIAFHSDYPDGHAIDWKIDFVTGSVADPIDGNLKKELE